MVDGVWPARVRLRFRGKLRNLTIMILTSLRILVALIILWITVFGCPFTIILWRTRSVSKAWDSIDIFDIGWCALSLSIILLLLPI